MGAPVWAHLSCLGGSGFPCRGRDRCAQKVSTVLYCSGASSVLYCSAASDSSRRPAAPQILFRLGAGAGARVDEGSLLPDSAVGSPALSPASLAASLRPAEVRTPTPSAPCPALTPRHTTFLIRPHYGLLLTSKPLYGRIKKVLIYNGSLLRAAPARARRALSSSMSNAANSCAPLRPPPGCLWVLPRRARRQIRAAASPAAPPRRGPDRGAARAA